jgi:hypothetical protein
LILWVDGSEDPDINITLNPNPGFLPPKSSVRPYATQNEVKEQKNVHGISLNLDFLAAGDDDFGMMAGFEDFDFSMEFPLPMSMWGRCLEESSLSGLYGAEWNLSGVSSEQFWGLAWARFLLKSGIWPVVGWNIRHKIMILA